MRLTPPSLQSGHFGGNARHPHFTDTETEARNGEGSGSAAHGPVGWGPATGPRGVHALRPPLPLRPVPCHRPHQRLRPGTRLTSHPAGQGGKNSSPRWGPAMGLCPEDLPPLALDLPGITSRGGLALSPPPGAGLRPPSLSSDSPPAHRSPYRPEVKPISSPRGPEGGCPAPEASLPLTIFSLAHWTEAAW